jgi:DNA oxidative demethylase
MIEISGFRIHKGCLGPAAQRAMAADIAGVVAAAPVFAPLTPWGKPMSVRMTSAGRYGWFTDSKGYRYIDRHPDGMCWPPIPDSVLAVWRALVSTRRMPDCCLVNWYGPKARMGLHRDADEADFAWPVLSISLGDPAVFRVGGVARSDPTTSVLLESGDVVSFGGAARLAYHGIDRIRAGGSRLLPEPAFPGGGRVNLTLRVVD